MNTVHLQRKAADELRLNLQPGERVTTSSMVTSDPSRWSAAVLGVTGLALATVGSLAFFGPLPSTPGFAVAVVLPVLGLATQFLPRPMYVVVTDRRLICSRVSRFGGRPKGPVIDAPLTELRIVQFRRGRSGGSIRCQVPGRKPITLHWSRASHADFGKVEAMLARSGAFAAVDPPYPPSLPSSSSP